MLLFRIQKKHAFLLLLIQFMALVSMAQAKYHSKAMQVLISGTSTLHDWTMKSTAGECSATFALNGSGQPTALSSMSFTIPATSLKSEHTSMDKNAYKALKTDKSASITYTLTSATVAANGSINCLGKLTIAGTTLDAPLAATAKVNADRSIAINVTKKISMKDFNMSPPTFMLGAVKTGNEVTLQFDLTLIKQ